MDNIEETRKLIDFIHRSPSCYHVVDNAAKMFCEAGFSEIQESQRYALEKGKAYFVKRNNSSIIAFRIPQAGNKGFAITAAHTDSPSFKLKGKPEIANDSYTTLNVEGYGGMLMAPWFDRPLSLAGRAFIRTDGGVQQRLVSFDRDLCQIVNLAIHMNRDANHGIDYKVQQDLLPVIAMGKHPGLVADMVASVLGVKKEDILDSELFLYNRMDGTIWGANDEFFSSPKIDDLQCAYCAIKAIITAQEATRIQVCALFDNEEVGSGTRQGALSDFLVQTLSRIGTAIGWDSEDQFTAQAQSFMLSADNGHALHPDHPEVADPTNHVLPNGGVVIKYSGNQKYTTDAYSGAVLKALLKKNGILYQEFYNNSNIPGGGTLGNISSAQYSIPTADIGAAQFAMHSPYETGGTEDTSWLLKAMKCFFES